MTKLTHKKTIKKNVAVCLLGIFLTPITLADEGHGHGMNHMGDQGNMMDQKQMNQHMQEVMGQGRINKVWAERHMLNISHEPISELNWPKMRMNFKTGEGVDLGNLQPGQEVTFTLQVDGANNYHIKKIEAK